METCFYDWNLAFQCRSFMGLAHFGVSFDWPLEEFALRLQFWAIEVLLSLKACSFFNFNFFKYVWICSKVFHLWQWEKLQMTASERRKIMCSVTFHIIAITCVVWSLYVLIDRTAEEIKSGQHWHSRTQTNTKTLIQHRLWYMFVLDVIYSSTIVSKLLLALNIKSV